ncbi:AAA family ATPase [Amycolatopsis japonica]
MAINLADFAAGAVRVHDPRTQVFIDDLISHFPIARIHRKALRDLGSDIVYAAPSPIFNDHGSWICLVRFGKVIENRFGLTREVLAYYSPHRDLQLRSYQRLSELANKTPRPATPDIFLLWSADPAANRRLDDWSSKSSQVVVALPRADTSAPAHEIWSNLSKRLTGTNLYDQTLPVTGQDFFGRQTSLRQLTEHLTAGRVSGVFGLRKTGKTSLVKELGRRAESAPEVHQIFVLRDLETLPSLKDVQVPNLIEDLKVNLLSELRSEKLRTFELANLSSHPTVSEFRRALHYLLTHISKQDVNVVLALDEIESLVGPAADWNSDRPEVVELLGALRALVQENDNFNVLVSGLTSSILEKGELFSRENPFFAWASTLFIPPLTVTECTEILENVGERMAVTWTPEASLYAARISDGHVFLLRTLAAHIVEGLPRDLAKRTVTREILEFSLRSWRRSVAGQVHEMLESVSRYYPDEYSIFDLLRTSPTEAQELEDEYPSIINHLLHLGLIIETSSGIRLSTLTDFGRRSGVR